MVPGGDRIFCFFDILFPVPNFWIYILNKYCNCIRILVFKFLKYIQVRDKALRVVMRIFENFHHYPECFVSHLDIFEKLKDKNPYTITILIENINPKIWNRKEYVKKTKDSISSRYHEELYKAFFYEHGERKGYDVYAKYLKKYRNLWKKDKSCSEIDGYIIKHELEPKYSADILKRFKNHQK